MIPTSAQVCRSYLYSLFNAIYSIAMAPLPQYLTGNQADIQDFVARFDVCKGDFHGFDPVCLASVAITE